uniref:RING-type domain-containing protein n=1 Tax=Arundo donax TaxID=35708 RepID=A0A0A9DH11_ARUDO
MGFDNECILSIQSLPGEYFCPVCRTLIYPSEALQSQCTHLYCKPCLDYVVATTKACPYDGYLVTETDSKPLMESNKSLAETIGKVAVHCLYHKSGCQWQGILSACITHGTTCAYGNSPVVCNRCGTQIVHRQVQEHAQLCLGLQSQTQQTDGNQAQSSVVTTQAVTQDPSLVASSGSAAAAATILPSATQATAVTASAAATGGPGATTATTAAVPPSVAASAAASQTSTAEQWYQQQQLQYSQYYQQQYPGYNPYMQQYQQYGQYPQVYQQYTQPQMQVASQNVAQGSVQPASYVQPQVQPLQAQYVMQSQPQNQPQLQPLTGHPQSQQHPVQPQHQNQPHLPHLQAPAGQSQPQQPPPVQSAPQVPQAQPQSRVSFQLPVSQAQPTAHPPAPTQVGNQQLGIPSAQSTPLQVQPYVQAQHPQHVQLQALPPQKNLQPQMQLNTQIQQQSYPQPQAYAQPMPHVQPQITSYLQQQMPQEAPYHQQGLASQHPTPMRPPMPGQQPAMLPPQAVPQYQQNIGYHAQRPPMHSSIPSQIPQQGLPSHPYVSSQGGQSLQQGMPSSQQQHSQPSQPHGQPYTQQNIPGHGYAGHPVQTSAGKPTSHVAPSQQFQHQASVPVNDLQWPRTSDSVGLTSQSHGAGQPTGQGSLTSENCASKSGKPEVIKNAAADTPVSEIKNGGAESAVMRLTILGDENMNREHNDFGNVKKRCTNWHCIGQHRWFSCEG